MKTIKGYKFIKKDMKSQSGNIKWKKNIWKKHKGDIALCNSGFHACRNPLQSLDYIYGNRWFVVEAKGEFLEDKEDKFVASEMRLIKEIPIKKILVEFASRCAERCIKNFEKEYPDDKRPREAIEAAKKWNINPTEKNRKAAESVAESAARSVGSARPSARPSAWSSWSAAWSARSAAGSARPSAWSSWSAAWSARSAAWSVESAGSSKSARSAEKKWQEQILKKIIKRHIK